MKTGATQRLERGRDAAHHQVQAVRSPRREMCDVTTVVFVKVTITNVEMRG